MIHLTQIREPHFRVKIESTAKRSEKLRKECADRARIKGWKNEKGKVCGAHREGAKRQTTRSAEHTGTAKSTADSGQSGTSQHAKYAQSEQRQHSEGVTAVKEEV